MAPGGKPGRRIVNHSAATAGRSTGDPSSNIPQRAPSAVESKFSAAINPLANKPFRYVIARCAKRAVAIQLDCFVVPPRRDSSQ